ncbi:MAG: hypothetical protein JW924_07520 [Fusobacteriaceae bacterium]|nr:hypothetical protein [Fusobacteriaceae bacterium]
MAVAASSANFVHLLNLRNCYVEKDTELSGLDIRVRNLVIFPGIALSVTDCKISTSKNIVILGSLTAKRSLIESDGNVYQGFTGSLEELMSIAEFSQEQLLTVVEAVRRLNEEKRIS